MCIYFIGDRRIAFGWAALATMLFYGEECVADPDLSFAVCVLRWILAP
jgi:hypothetical protein